VDNADFEKSPIYVNMPPVSGALAWCSGLKERMKEPLDKLA
jgi:dynein heavy chain